VTPPPWRIEVHATLPSTQRLAAARAEAGEPGRLAILAMEQPAGQGRDGRGWASARGNLHLTAMLRPQRPAREVTQLVLAAAVAMHAAAAALAPVRLKWPNDLLRDGAKVGGLLAEARLEGERIAHLLFGFGINLAEAPAVPGRPTARLGPVAPEVFAQALLAQLDAWLARHAAAGFLPIRAAWMAAGPEPGAILKLRQGDSIAIGRYEGLDEDGALRLATEHGPRRFLAGELEGA
jgi:BirA family biotin operon repressor/biotin-[acetyl-CoA-carboxylase] ligase